MKEIWKLILVDDHALFREALKFVLAKTNVDIIGEATNGEEFLKMLNNSIPDLILMDISMPGLNGIEATKEALKRLPMLKIIALTMYNDESYYKKMLDAGVHGFVMKEAGGKELIEAIQKVMNGGSYFSNQMLCNIIRGMSHPEPKPSPPIDKPIKLTRRENEILRMICSGYSTVEIAHILELSKRTVEGHRLNLLKKTGSKNIIQLVLYSHKNKLVKIQEH